MSADPPKTRSLCFVLMPFGTKRDSTGGVVEFDDVYRHIIQPAVEDAGMQCVRADEESVGGIIHKPMFERLLLCEYAVADLTTANANVYYELGIRHTARPFSTVLTCADGYRVPFDLDPIRSVRYRLSDVGIPDDATNNRRELTHSLRDASRHLTDSPLFQLCNGLEPMALDGLDSAAFRDRLAGSERLQSRLARCRDREDVRRVRAQLPDDLRTVEAGVLVDLLLAYRQFNMFDDIVALVAVLPREVARNAEIREKHAFALNRIGRRTEAEQLLVRLHKERGPSSETWGLLGRIHKDRWEAAKTDGQSRLADAHLARAIDAYTRGFESDWRDYYPGINAIQLRWIKDPDDPRIRELLPVVAYAVRQRLESGNPTFWDYATTMEIEIYRGDMNAALSYLGDALAEDPKPMEAQSFLDTIRRLRRVRRVIRPDAPAQDWDELEQSLVARIATTQNLQP